ncbi:MAG: methyltransferase domain-containing protein [Planctomycetota bacterium]
MPRRGKPRGKGGGRGPGKRPRPGPKHKRRGPPQDEAKPRRVVHPLAAAEPEDEDEAPEEAQDAVHAPAPPRRAVAPALERAAPPWEHPDWYDLHDDAWTAGIEREAEHYKELILALPPLDAHDHLVDVGCGTGKAARQIAAAYPNLGRVTLIEPNAAKLDRAEARVRQALPQAVIQSLAVGVGEGVKVLPQEASLVVATSVIMPTLEARGGTLQDGVDWALDALSEVHAMLDPGGWFYVLETLPPPWTAGDGDDPVRRLTFVEFEAALQEAGFVEVQCVYRYRDRVAFAALKDD